MWRSKPLASQQQQQQQQQQLKRPLCLQGRDSVQRCGRGLAVVQPAHGAAQHPAHALHLRRHLRGHRDLQPRCLAAGSAAHRAHAQAGATLLCTATSLQACSRCLPILTDAAQHPLVVLEGLHAKAEERAGTGHQTSLLLRVASSLPHDKPKIRYCCWQAEHHCTQVHDMSENPMAKQRRVRRSGKAEGPPWRHASWRAQLPANKSEAKLMPLTQGRADSLLPRCAT